MNKIFFNKMGLNKNFIFNIEKCPLDHDFYIHSHDFSELVVILKGSAIHIVNGREYVLKAGEVFLIHEDVNHGYKNVNGLEYFNIMFDPEIIQKFSELKKMKGFQALFFIEPYYRSEQSFGSKLILSPLQLRKVEAALDIVLEEYRQVAEGYQAMISSYFTSVLIMLSRYYSAYTNEASQKVLQMAGAITYIEENYLYPITLNQLSELASISSRHFVRVFRKNYDTTPLDYIIHLRLNHAALLMNETGLSISQIAMESGFNDQNYFSRQFHKVFGVSPTDYRRRFL